MPVFRQLSDKPREIVSIGTILHQVVGNLAEAAVKNSVENATVSTDETERSSASPDFKVFKVVRIICYRCQCNSEKWIDLLLRST